MIKKLLFSLFILVFIIFFFSDRKVTTTQLFNSGNFEISVKHRNNIILSKNSYTDGYEMGDFISLKKEDQEFYNIKIDYVFENNGDDTPYQAGDTGAGLWPPQPDELIIPLTDEYVKIGDWLGYDLYVPKNIDEYGTKVYQEVYPNEITDYMTLLNKNKSRVNYYDRFMISYIPDETRSITQQNKEFIKILKSMKITETKKLE